MSTQDVDLSEGMINPLFHFDTPERFPSPDEQYLYLLNKLTTGTPKHDRTGVGTRGLFGCRMNFDLSNGRVPLLTTKKVFTKAIIHELLWMLSGDTNVRYLNDHKVTIWNSWVKPETALYRNMTWVDILPLIEKRGLTESFRVMVLKHFTEAELEQFMTRQATPWNNDESNEQYQAWKADMHRWFEANEIPTSTLAGGELPKIYQHQWRQWEDTRLISVDEWLEDSYYQENDYSLIGEYHDVELGESVAVVRRHVDQIQKVIDQLKTNPDSRRIIVSAWNAAEIEEMALPPCHTLFQFYTREMEHSERETWLEHNLGHEVRDRFVQELKEVSSSNDGDAVCDSVTLHALLDHYKVPRRALSSQLYQR